MRTRSLRRGLLVGAVLAVILTTTAGAAGNVYGVHNLVSDQPGIADNTDPLLVNAWGLAALPTSPWWVADNETNVATIYGADGATRRPPVNVDNAPTGLVANTTPSFEVSMGDVSGTPLFIFDTEEGKVLGWSPSVAPNDAVVGADLSSEDAVFKGLAIASTADGDFLYATDFHNGRVDVFDGSFDQVHMPGAFTDRHIPSDYAPFGIQTISGHVFVTYAKQGEGDDELHGQGLGFVDEYTPAGALVRRVATHGQLNAPWGLAAAPASFGALGGDLLIGNFGDGRINAYAQGTDGSYERQDALRGADHKPLDIDGLWALQFGHGAANNGPTDTLFFTAGPDDESHGLFGTIQAG
jgi:uncharacterized protein (TIGR03118 family)